MQNIWLYHINPANSEGWTYGWDVDQPRTLLTSRDKEWPAGNMFRQVLVGDLICINMKNMDRRPSGVHVVGIVTKVLHHERTFVWRPDKARSARTLVSPIETADVRRYFGRGYASALQRLPADHHREWLKLLGEGEVTDGVPLLEVTGRPKASVAPDRDPQVSREHGLLGERHVLKILRKRYPTRDGFHVDHVAKTDPFADHDVAVYRGTSRILIAEVKTRVGYPGDPVIVSERELQCRRANQFRHRVFIVYLAPKGAIRCVLEIGREDSFALSPRQSWMTPAVGSAQQGVAADGAPRRR